MDFLRSAAHLGPMPQGLSPSRRVRHDVVFVHALDLPEIVGSYRTMSMMPAHEIGARFINLAAGESAKSFLARTDPELIVCGKAFENEEILNLCDLAQRQGRKVITWHCDLPTAAASREFSRRLMERSDAVVVQTKTMAEFVSEISGRQADLIEEWLEYPENDAPQFRSDRKPLRLLWYGHTSNFDTIAPMLDSLSAGVGVNIALVCLAGVAPPSEVSDRLASLRTPPFEVSWVQWSRLAQLQAMRASDIVLAPSADTPEKRAKGHNRVAEALNQSCVVVAHPLPQYEEFADFIMLERDTAAGVRKVLADPRAALARATAGAKAVRERFAADVLARKWIELIERVMAS